jgi:hypothetical protein
LGPAGPAAGPEFANLGEPVKLTDSVSQLTDPVSQLIEAGGGEHRAEGGGISK